MDGGVGGDGVVSVDGVDGGDHPLSWPVVDNAAGGKRTKAQKVSTANHSFLSSTDLASLTKTSQELRMLSSVTLNCQVTKIVKKSSSQLSEM